MFENLRKSTTVAAGADVPRDKFGRCALCGGPGQKSTGEWCECPIGRDLANFERWNAVREAEKAAKAAKALKGAVEVNQAAAIDPSREKPPRNGIPDDTGEEV
jgi:hypothetical protein